MSKPVKYLRQTAILGKDLDPTKRIVNVQFVKNDADGDLTPANLQEQFVMEFTDDIGKLAHVTAAPTADQFNALLDQFNELVAKAEACGILHRLSTK